MRQILKNEEFVMNSHVCIYDIEPRFLTLNFKFPKIWQKVLLAESIQEHHLATNEISFDLWLNGMLQNPHIITNI